MQSSVPELCFAESKFISSNLFKASGNVWCVNPTTGLDTNSGTNWQQPFLSIAHALVVSSPFDVILVAMGDINEEGLNITKRGIKLLGLTNSGLTRSSPLFIGTTQTIIRVRADDVEIGGFGFAQTFAAPALIIADDAGALPAWRSKIHDCYIDGWNTATYGIELGQAVQEAVATIIERCKFTSIVTANIRNNSENVVIQDTIHNVNAAGIGIQDVPNGSDRPNRYYLSNRFNTLDNVNAVGISVLNTPDPGQVMIDGNHFVNFADAAHSCDVCGSGKTGLMGLNYDGITPLPIV